MTRVLIVPLVFFVPLMTLMVVGGSMIGVTAVVPVRSWSIDRRMSHAFV